MVEMMRGVSMKRKVYIILTMSLLSGLGLMVLDFLSSSRTEFRVPPGFNPTVVELSEGPRQDESVFQGELAVPSVVQFFLQSDAEGNKEIWIRSASEVLGSPTREIYMVVGEFTGSSSVSVPLFMDAGRYSVHITHEQVEGQVLIATKETALEPQEFSRLLRIHQGDLDNPPPGYAEVFSISLQGLTCQDETMHTLSLTRAQEVGLAVYTSARQGMVRLDLVGQSSSYYGLVTEESSINNQLQTTLSPGKYVFKLTCADADGEVHVYLKQ